MAFLNRFRSTGSNSSAFAPPSYAGTSDRYTPSTYYGTTPTPPYYDQRPPSFVSREENPLPPRPPDSPTQPSQALRLDSTSPGRDLQGNQAETGITTETLRQNRLSKFGYGVLVEARRSTSSLRNLRNTRQDASNEFGVQVGPRGSSGVSSTTNGTLSQGSSGAYSQPRRDNLVYNPSIPSSARNSMNINAADYPLLVTFGESRAVVARYPAYEDMIAFIRRYWNVPEAYNIKLHMSYNGRLTDLVPESWPSLYATLEEVQVFTVLTRKITMVNSTNGAEISVLMPGTRAEAIKIARKRFNIGEKQGLNFYCELPDTNPPETALIVPEDWNAIVPMVEKVEIRSFDLVMLKIKWNDITIEVPRPDTMDEAAKLCHDRLKIPRNRELKFSCIFQRTNKDLTKIEWEVLIKDILLVEVSVDYKLSFCSTYGKDVIDLTCPGERKLGVTIQWYLPQDEATTAKENREKLYKKVPFFVGDSTRMYELFDAFRDQMKLSEPAIKFKFVPQWCRWVQPSDPFQDNPTARDLKFGRWTTIYAWKGKW